MRTHWGYANPVIYLHNDCLRYLDEYFRKIINELDMDLVEYFTQNYKEFDVLEQDTDELKKITGLHLSNIGKDDFFYIDSKTAVHPMKILVGLLKAKGNLTKAAVDMGCRRDKLERYILNNQKVKVGAEIIHEMVIDYVEAQLMQKIDDGDRSAIQYWLNTQAIHRGYGTYEQRRRVRNMIADATGKTGGGDNFTVE